MSTPTPTTPSTPKAETSPRPFLSRLMSPRSAVDIRLRTEIYAWGWALSGQLGSKFDASSTFGGNVSFPNKIDALQRQFVKQVCCGSRSTLVLTDNGAVYSFGRGDDGQLGHNVISGEMHIPQLIDRLANHRIVHISCRSCHCTAVSSDKEVWTWGKGEDGQLGHGTVTSLSIPTRVQSITGAIKAATGRQHTVVLTDSGALHCMGSNIDGQLGNGEVGNALFPVQVTAPGMEFVVDITCGSRHTIALTKEGEVYAWGSNGYGQLGNGSTVSSSRPVHVVFLQRVSQVACGFRHSFAMTEDGVWFGWGWNEYRQLAHDHADGLSKTCSTPTQCSFFRDHGPLNVYPGGRHTMVVTESGQLFTFGRGADGQLGHADLQDRHELTFVKSLQYNKVLFADCGWTHSVAVTRPADRQSLAGEKPSKRPGMIRRGDWDAFFGVFFNVLINLTLISVLCTSVVGLSPDFVMSRVLPASGLCLFCGATFFGIQCKLLARSRGYSATAQPFGLDTPIMLSTIFLLMAPRSEESGPESAWRLGLFSAVIVGVLQILGAFVGDWLRKNIPRPALLAALAGIGIGFISESFLFQIYSDPVVAVLPMILIWVSYASGIQLPFGLPGSVAAVLIGIAIGFICWGAGFDFWKPFQGSVEKTPHFLHFALKEIGEEFGKATSWNQIALIVPLCVINIVGSLVNLEYATGSGDPYSTRQSMIAAGCCTLIGAAFGNPFPCCIFMGHSAWKAVGARADYSFLCAFASLAICVFNGVTALTQVMPMESTVGILLWVGLAVTAQAYESVPGERPHLLAVSIGILPAVASWAMQLVSNYLGKVGSSLAEVHSEAADLYIDGMISFSQGFLLLAVLLASLVVFISNRDFAKATVVTSLLSILSFVGVIHAFEFTPSHNIQPKLGLATAGKEAFGYALSTVLLFSLHLGGFSEDDNTSVQEKLWGLLTYIPRRVKHYTRRDKKASDQYFSL